MARAIVVMCIALLSCGFAWPPDYAEQSRADVVTCVGYARLISPGFVARVNSIDLQSGRVEIQSSPGDSRGERAFSKCLLSVRQWRLIEQYLPKTTELEPQHPATMAGRAPDILSR